MRTHRDHLPERGLRPAHYQQTVKEQVMPLLAGETETCPLDRALGRVTSSDLKAVENLPAFTNSQMDGYALTAAAAGRQNRIFTVGSDIPAGSDPAGLPIDDETVYPIMTGAALPAGYDCVVPEEDAKPLGATEGGFAAVGSRVHLPVSTPGAYVRAAGQDVAAGEKLLSAATVLEPVHLGLLAAQGIDRVPVLVQPKVLILTGGDEVVSTANPHTGQIRDANGPMLDALLSKDGARTKRLALNDDPYQLVTQLKEALAYFQPQLIVSSGGISHGKYEVVKNTVDLLAAEVSESPTVIQRWFGHVAQQPGGPQGLIELAATVEGQPQNLVWLAFPGNPVSTLVSYTLFLAPIFASYRGQEDSARFGILAEGADIHGLADKTQFRRARVHCFYSPQGSTPEVLLYPDPHTGSHLLQRASRANALVEIAAGTDYTPGDTLRWYPL